MRNFHFSAPKMSTVMIDFLARPDELSLVKKNLTRTLLALFETSELNQMTPSEERAMTAFWDWFHLFEVAGSRISESYPRMSMSIDLPDNTAYVYVNLNTGHGLVLTGMFDDGYGDYTFGAEVFP